MTSGEGMFEVAFRGIKAIGDMALWRQPHNDCATNVLLSLYGSESQLRGIFSALATNNEITVGNSLDLLKGRDGHLRFKSWRIGYGKYHALVWNEDLVTDCIAVVDPAGEIDAWEAFLQKKKVPFIREWTARLVAIMVRDGLVEELGGINLKGWLWTASDDTACDRIVEEIYR
jgi:hypothetical protein